MAGVTSIKTASGAHAEVKGKYIKTGANSYAQIKQGYVKAANPAYLELPTGYTQLQYIESSGTQYIDTGVTPSATDNEIELEFTAGNVEGSLFGAYSSGKDTITCFWGQFWIAGTNPINYTLQSGKKYLLKVHAQDNTITTDLNGEIRTGSYTGPMPTGSSFALFAQNNGTVIKNHCAIKLERAKIRTDGVLRRDYVPGENASGTAGLYDMVSDAFHTNAGTGAFAAGDTVKAIDAMLFYESAKSISTATVTLGANLTYNGSQQTKAVTVTMDGVTLTQGTDYTVTGNTGTNAGNYTMTITGIGDYEGTVQKAWSIAKASGSISVSPASLTIAGAVGTTKTATISYTGDGSISVSSSNESIAAASRSGNTITVTLKSTGSATITITLNAGTNYTGASCTLGVAARILTLSYYGTATALSRNRETLAATTVGNYALFGGGGTFADGQFNTVDAYNTSLTRSTPTALIQRSYELAATTVGNYALFGGGYRSAVYSNNVDAYNASLTRSTPTALSEGRSNLAATTVGNYALFGGGYGENDEVGTVDAYNTSLTRSTPTALSEGRDELAATTVGNYALFGGGYRGSRDYSNNVDAYNASLTRSTPTALSFKRDELAATTVGNYALFGGGHCNDSTGINPNYFNTVDAYDTSLTRRLASILSYERSNLAATTVGNYALFGGGYGENDEVGTVDAYDTSLTRSTPTALSEGRDELAATTVGNYALFGGGDGENDEVGIVDVYQYA